MKLKIEKLGEAVIKSKDTTDSDIVFVELDRAFEANGCGKFIRLGPLDGKDIQIAFYQKKEQLTKSSDKATSYSLGCSWGIFTRSKLSD